MGRKLGRSVSVDGKTWLAGSEPPAEVADKIHNDKAWEAEEPPTPLEIIEDAEERADARRKAQEDAAAEAEKSDKGGQSKASAAKPAQRRT